MRKFSVIALALAAVMFFAVQAAAVEVELSGEYRVRGFYDHNTDLNDNTGASDAAMDMWFSVSPVFKIHDNLKITTLFDGQDERVFGDNETLSGARGGGGVGTEDFGLERVYVDADFDTIGLRVGRMAEGACGINYCNSEGDSDRIKVIFKNIDPFYLDFTYDKFTEQDYVSGDSSTTANADEDYDAYWIHTFYSDETITGGMLFGLYRDATTRPTADGGFKREYWMFDPYVKGAVGPFSYLAEAQWKTGDYFDYDPTVSTANRDYDSWRYILDVAYDFGAGNVGAGYAHADGQKYDASGTHDYTNADLGGSDWEPFLILTNASANSGLGGTSINNFNPDNASDAVKEFGFDIFYVYGSFVPMEKLTLSAIVGMATADETNTPSANSSGWTNVDDEVGWELDIGAEYQLMDNLTYDVKLGFFQAGDLYKLGAASTTVDDTWSVLHSLVVTF